ncbi:glycosyltransferase [Leifsonia sp. Root112D2]|uniref:glycosyltransferase n=1 Tax=Leifsonia sp. Root112D2 TaxID=1736426 RepID=UPI0006F5BA87|nr:glycosyltransferase [Leifsonia sp. Root112D2]KQV06131.1 hypothetical protein ASC63_01175 [Leifsonia sp. Root112D2]
MTEAAFFTSYGRQAGSARVRVFEWLEHLGAGDNVSSYLGQSSNSISTVARQPLKVVKAERQLRQRARSVGEATAFISRQASPFSNGTIERKILSRANHGVYDFDDALMYTPSSAVERVWSKRRIWRQSVQAADVVIAGNDYLAEAAGRQHENVVVIPSCVEPNDYVAKQAFEISDVPSAVWLGSPSTEQYLSEIAEPLLALHESRGLRLTVISAGDASLAELDRMVDRVQWTLDGYQEHLARADFGIMPLQDSAWSRGKCAYKLLQYGASALPMIGSDVGTNRKVLQLADGLAASTSAEWRDGLETLIDEPATRRAERARSSRAAIIQHYSFSAWADTWRETVGLPTPNGVQASRPE